MRSGAAPAGSLAREIPSRIITIESRSATMLLPCLGCEWFSIKVPCVRRFRPNPLKEQDSPCVVPYGLTFPVFSRNRERRRDRFAADYFHRQLVCRKQPGRAFAPQSARICGFPGDGFLSAVRKSASLGAENALSLSATFFTTELPVRLAGEADLVEHPLGGPERGDAVRPAEAVEGESGGCSAGEELLDDRRVAPTPRTRGSTSRWMAPSRRPPSVRRSRRSWKAASTHSICGRGSTGSTFLPELVGQVRPRLNRAFTIPAHRAKGMKGINRADA